MCVCNAHGVRREPQILWSWSYRQLKATKFRCWELLLLAAQQSL